MEQPTRRRFLGAATATLGAAAGFDLLPTSMQKAIAATPQNDLKDLQQIEHVIILQQENRSFDHYFGTMSGVRGFDDPHPQVLPNGRSVFYQPDPQHPDGYVLPFHLDTTKSSAAAVQDPGHGWPVQHQMWNAGKMDNFVPAQKSAGGLVMGYYTRNDIPFHYALADAFTICDAYHCSVMAPTWPTGCTP